MILASGNGTAADSLLAESAAARNPETSRLGSVEFNTPYAHEIAALSVVLAIVATVSIALAVKYTRRGPSSEPDDALDEIDGKALKSSWECAPIMNRLGRKYSYESLQQTECRECGNGRGSFHFSSRLDVANGLLCLFGIRLKLHAVGVHQQPLVGWQIAIDIVTQTDVECRQTRLSTRMASVVPMAGVTCGEKNAVAPSGCAEGACWSEPMEDVVAVRINQDPGTPVRGQLLIRVRGHRPCERDSYQQQHQVPLVKLGGATFQLGRIGDVKVAFTSVTLRDEP